MPQSIGHVATHTNHLSSPSRTSLSPSGYSDAPSPSAFRSCDTTSTYDTSASQGTLPSDDTITVEELSDTDSGYPSDALILHPYELEEAETSSDNESTHGSRRSVSGTGKALRRMRHNQPTAVAASSPLRLTSRKRPRAEALETDTESETDARQSSSEPPRSRRRIAQGYPRKTPSLNLNLSTISEASDASPRQTRPFWVSEDAMDVDSQAAPAI